MSITNKIRSIGCLLVLVCLTANHTCAQNVMTELMLLKNHYADMERYSVSMTYKAYNGHNSQTVVDMLTGKFESWGNKKRFVLGRSEIIQNGSYLIQLDHELQEMDVIPTKTPATGMPAFGDLEGLEKLVQKNNAVSFRQEAGGIRLLVFDLKKSGDEHEKIELRYLPSGNIVSVTLFYRASMKSYGRDDDYKPRVEIQYRDHNFATVYEAEHFSEKKFFLIQNDAVIPQPAYKNYKIFDSL